MPRKTTMRCRGCSRELPKDQFAWLDHRKRRDLRCAECREVKSFRYIAPKEIRRPLIGTCVDCGDRTSRYCDRCQTCSGKLRSQKSREAIPPPNPSGLCQCGCQQPAPIATYTRRDQGIVAGHPIRYIKGHATRKSHVDYIVEDRGYHEGPCWIWQLTTGGENSTGYGRKTINGASVNMHIYFYEQANGPIPKGMDLHHLYDQRACVKPAHLEPLTRAEHRRRARDIVLNEEKVRIIRRLKGTMSAPKIAAIVDAPTPAIYAVLEGHTWKEVV